jgi:hypothetical protein
LSLLTSISSEHNTPFHPSLSRATPTALSSTEWSENEGVLFSLEEQFKVLGNKFKFPWKKNALNMTDSR